MSRAVSSDLAEILAENGPALVIGDNLFIGPVLEVDGGPPVDEACVFVLQTGGVREVYLTTERKTFRTVNCQVKVRYDRESFGDGELFAMDVFDALHLANASPYTSIIVNEGAPFYGGTDSAGRPWWSFTVDASYTDTAGESPSLTLSGLGNREVQGDLQVDGDFNVDGAFTVDGAPFVGGVTEEELEEALAPLILELDDLDAALDVLTPRVDDLEADLSALTSTVGTVSASVDSLEGLVAALDAELTTLDGTVSSLSSTVSGHTTSIGTLNTTVSGHTTSIATNASNLTAHAAATTTHGVSGALVGTTDAQNISNKTFTTKVNVVGPASGQVAVEMESGRSIKFGSNNVQILDNGGSFFVNSLVQMAAGFIFKGSCYWDNNGGALFSNQTSAASINNTTTPGWSIGCGNVIGAGKNIVGFISGGTQTGCAVDGTGALHLAPFTVATAPSASTVGANAIIYVSNGDAGAKCLAMSDGTDWKRIPLGATISAT